ncbi:hypothetical protein H0H92_007357 [Tricholoma furcatifolium]|nr:hypothetical protein H0H92_007357 [Tricholoma furcatifolium]
MAKVCRIYYVWIITKSLKSVLLRKLSEAALPVLNYKHLLHLVSLENEGSLRLDGGPGHALQSLLDLRPMQMLRPTGNIHLSSEGPFKLILKLDIQYRLRIFDDLKALHVLLLSINANEYNSFDIELRLSANSSSDSHVGRLKPVWFKLFTEVMNSVASKPHSTLTIIHDAVSNQVSWTSKGLGRPFVYQIEADSRDRRICGMFAVTRLISPGEPSRLSLENGPLNQYTHPLQPIIKACPISVSPPPSPVFLEHFHIHSELLLRLPFFHWTITMISSSPITTLSFSSVQLTRYEWNYILSSISLSTLSTFSLGTAHVTAVDLLAFFIRHPSITTLDFSTVALFGRFEIPLHLRDKLLPSLTTLLADPWDLASFFSHPSTFPKLASITIFAKYSGPFTGSDPGRFERRPFEAVLYHLTERAKQSENSPQVSLAVHFGGMSIRTSLRNVQMHNNPAAFQPYFSVSPHTDDAALVLEKLKIPNVSELNLVIRGQPTSRLEHQRIYLDYFIQFLKMFTSLKKLTMKSTSRMPGYASELYADATRRVIWESLPTLETFDGLQRADDLAT